MGAQPVFGKGLMSECARGSVTQALEFFREENRSTFCRRITVGGYGYRCWVRHDIFNIIWSIIFGAVDEIDRHRTTFRRIILELFLTFRAVRDMCTHSGSLLGLLDFLRLVPLKS